MDLPALIGTEDEVVQAEDIRANTMMRLARVKADWPADHPTITPEQYAAALDAEVASLAAAEWWIDMGRPFAGYGDPRRTADESIARRVQNAYRAQQFAELREQREQRKQS